MLRHEKSIQKCSSSEDKKRLYLSYLGRLGSFFRLYKRNRTPPLRGYLRCVRSLFCVGRAYTLRTSRKKQHTYQQACKKYLTKSSLYHCRCKNIHSYISYHGSQGPIACPNVQKNYVFQNMCKKNYVSYNK